VPLESASYINSLDVSNPASTDLLSQADDHIRLLKSVLKSTFPNITGPVTLTQDVLNAPFGMAVGSIVMWYGSSAAVPSGWALCDGRTVSLTAGGGTITTPDLRDRTPIGVGALATTVGGTIGSTSSSGTTGTAGSHTHIVDGGSHVHTGQVLGTSLTSGQIPAHYHYEFSTTNGVYGNLGGNPEGAPSQGGSGASSGASYNIGSDGTSVASLGRSSSVGGGQSHNHGLSIDATTHTHACNTTGDHQHSVTLSTVQPCMGLHFIMKV
jgi:microcystin-dependent protein